MYIEVHYKDKHIQYSRFPLIPFTKIKSYDSLQNTGMYMDMNLQMNKNCFNEYKSASEKDIRPQQVRDHSLLSLG